MSLSNIAVNFASACGRRMNLNDMDIKRLKALSPGERTNKVLYHLLQPFLLGYWLFSEPKYKGIELADCLFLWNDVLFLIEAKTREGQGPGSDAWIRNRLKDAAERLSRRKGMLQRGDVKELRNPYHGLVAWNPDRIKFYYGIILINHISEPYEPRDLAPDVFRCSELPLQVFSLFDFAELVRFQSTAYDFLAYYELRLRFGRRFRCPVHSEFETYKEILNLLPEFMGEQYSKAGETQKFMISMSNAIMRSKIATYDDFIQLTQGLLIDVAIASVERKAEQDHSGMRVGNRDHMTFVRSVEAMAELTRIRRSHYGRLWVDAATKALEANYSSSKIGYSPSRSRSYVVYAFSPDDNDCERKLKTKAAEAMKQHDSASCVALGATSLNILATFNTILDWVRGRNESELPDEYILDTMGLFVEIN